MILPTIALLVTLAAPAPPEGPIRAVVLARDGDLTVRLHVHRQASLASAGWLALELDNAGPDPLEVTNVYYRIESERANLKTRQGVSSGGLASGNDPSLFPDAWKVRPVPPRVLPAGKALRVADDPSDYSAALLGPAGPDGLLVRATCHLDLTLKDGRTLATPPAGVPFAFEWLPLDAAGTRAAGDRLRGLLAKPENTAPHGYLIDALLRVPDVARLVSRDELLAGLAKRSHPFDGRRHVANALAARFKDDPAVVAFYRDRLAAGDARAVADLAESAVWHPSFTEPLVARYEAGPTREFEALTALHRHRAALAPAAKAGGRLSAAVRKAFPVAATPVGTLAAGDLPSWAVAARLLGQTGDPAAVETLRPALDDRRQVYPADVRAGWAAPDGPPRVCDVAAGAVRDLLGDAPAGRAPFDAVPGAELKIAGPADRDTMRDGVIAELKERMDRRKP